MDNGRNDLSQPKETSICFTFWFSLLLLRLLINYVNLVSIKDFIRQMPFSFHRIVKESNIERMAQRSPSEILRSWELLWRLCLTLRPLFARWKWRARFRQTLFRLARTLENVASEQFDDCFSPLLTWIWKILWQQKDQFLHLQLAHWRRSSTSLGDRLHLSFC